MWAFFRKLFRKSSDSTISKKLKKQKGVGKKLKAHEWSFRVGILLAALLIITYFLPSPNPFNFTFGEGEPWHYAPLYSSYKFNINMSDSVLQVKQDSVKKDFEPYFTKQSLMQDSVKTKIRKAADKLSESNPKYSSLLVTAYLHSLFQQIDSIYDKGVMSQTCYDSLMMNGTREIRIVDNNIANFADMNEVYSLQTAYKKLMSPVRMATEGIDTLRQQFLSAMNINTLLTENISYDNLKSELELQAMIDSLSPTIGLVMENEKIIDRGEIVTKEKMAKLNTYMRVVSENTSSERPLSTLIGQIALVLIVLLVLNSFLFIFRKDYFANLRAYIMLFSLPTIFCSLSSTLIEHHLLHVFIIPFCMVPIIIRVFMDSRVAFVFHLGTVIIATISMSYPYEFIILQVIAGMVAVQSLRQMTQRSQIVSTMVIITLTLLCTHGAYEMMTHADFTRDHFDKYPYYFLTVSGLLLLFAYPLLWIMEKFFMFTSDVTLVELSNTNNTLLQKLMEEAPGTFQHSMQVATLAAEIAGKIDANVQLVRTGALYHDIGKLSRPVFYTENQSDKNPHERISPLKSAEVIIAHVTEGIKLAEHYDLPEVIKRFILTHHGKGKVRYFYITYKNEHPDEEIDESLFTYPGPNPESKEEGILMMSDAVEAASRSLNEYTEENISNLVEKIVKSQMDEGYYDECNLTFKDIFIAKKALKERLKTIYHTRISYPELKSEEAPQSKT